MDNELIKMLANNKDEKFYLTKEEEKEFLKTLPDLVDDKFENVLLEW
jgi:hypothetical protein